MLGLGGTASSEGDNSRPEAAPGQLVRVMHLAADGPRSGQTAVLSGGQNEHSFLLNEDETLARTGVAGLTRGVLHRGDWQYLIIDARPSARYIGPSSLQQHDGLSGHYEVDVQAKGSESLNIGAVPLLIARLPVGDVQATAVSLHPFLDTGAASTIDIDPVGDVVLYAIGRDRMPGTTHVALETPSGTDTSADIRLAIDTTGVEAEFVQPAGPLAQLIGRLPVVGAVLQAL